MKTAYLPVISLASLLGAFACSSDDGAAETLSGTETGVTSDESDFGESGDAGGDDGGGSCADCFIATQVVASKWHTCARSAKGEIKCWGANTSGMLGYSMPTPLHIGDDETPASHGPVDIGKPAVYLAAGSTHNCVVLDDGDVRCWGANLYGQLGYGHTDWIGDDEPPAAAASIDLGRRAVQLALGSRHTCALLETGAVKCWGYATSGALGYANTDHIGDDEAAASLGEVDVGGTVVELAAGDHHTCARLDTGAMRCWGENTIGQLGYGHLDRIGDDETPASAGNVHVGGRVVQIAAAQYHTCAVLATGSLRCWGANIHGQLGYGHTLPIGDDETPASAGDIDVGGPVTQVVAGAHHTCALLDTGAVRCWGKPQHGALGYGNLIQIGDDETPASVGVVDIGAPVVELVSRAATHTCALLDGGDLRCWGDASRGALGYGNTENIGDDETPASVGLVPYD